MSESNIEHARWWFSQPHLGLRPYQITACIAMTVKLYNGLSAYHADETQKQPSTMLVLPTGAGKTRTASTWMRYIIETFNARILWLTHRHELLSQASHSFRENCPHVRIDYWAADAKMDTGANVVFAMMLSTMNRFQQEKPFDVVIIDEAHKLHASDNTYQKLLTGRTKDNNMEYKFLVGLTATPLDAKSRMQVEIDNICYQITFIELVRQGYLAKPNYFRFKTDIPVEEQLAFNNGEKDFTEDCLKKLDNDRRNDIIISEYIEKQSIYQKTIFFCINVAHARELQSQLHKKAPHIKSALVTGETKDEERERIVEDYKEGGSIQVLFNCEVFIEGFDEPSINTVFLCRPTLSERIYMQQIGRGSRIIKGKKATFNIVDFVDLSDYYALACEEWAIKIGAPPDEQFHKKLEDKKEREDRKEKIASVSAQLVDAGFSTSIRARVSRELFEICGIFRTCNKDGEIRKYVLTRSQKRALDGLMNSVENWTYSGDHMKDMDSIIWWSYNKFCRVGKGKAALCNISQWKNMAWGARRALIDKQKEVYSESLRKRVPTFEFQEISF